MNEKSDTREEKVKRLKSRNRPASGDFERGQTVTVDGTPYRVTRWDGDKQKLILKRAKEALAPPPELLPPVKSEPAPQPTPDELDGDLAPRPTDIALVKPDNPAYNPANVIDDIRPWVPKADGRCCEHCPKYFPVCYPIKTPELPPAPAQSPVTPEQAPPTPPTREA